MKVAGSFPAGIGSRLKLLNTYFLLIRAGLGRILPGRSGPTAVPGPGAAPASLPSGWGGVTGRGDAAEKPLNTQVPHRWPHAASPPAPGRQGSAIRRGRINPSCMEQKVGTEGAVPLRAHGTQL